jgi:hypothetical protein
MKKGKVYLSGKLYYKLYKERKLRSLAYYILWSAKHPHKQFNIKTEGNVKTIYKHLKILKSFGLVDYNNYQVFLSSNKKIRTLFNDKQEKLFFNVKDDVDSIYAQLKSIPIVSNLHSQLNGIERKKYFRTILHNSQKGNGNVTVKGYKRLKKYLKKKGWNLKVAKEKLQVQDDCNISVDKICQLLSTTSRNTAVKYRRLMCSHFEIDSFKRWERVFGIKDYNTFIVAKRYNPQLVWNTNKNYCMTELSRGFTLSYLGAKEKD